VGNTALDAKEVTLNHGTHSFRLALTASAVVALTTAAPGVALAQVKPKALLYTSPLVAAGANQPSCGLNNVGSAAVSVTVELIRFDGTAINPFTLNALEPGNSYVVTYTTNGEYSCRFTMVSGSPDSIRARMTIRNPNEGDIAVSEAR
jgi:hypothetical protein